MLLPEEKAKLEDAFREAEANVRLEGLEPTENFYVVKARVFAGTITFEQGHKEISQLSSSQVLCCICMRFEDQDPYCYPNTNVLGNLRELHDQVSLDRFEADAVAADSIALEFDPLKGPFTTKRLLSTHRRLFGRVYAWAGEYAYRFWNDDEAPCFGTIGDVRASSEYSFIFRKYICRTESRK